jgi:hypothetical protein
VGFDCLNIRVGLNDDKGSWLFGILIPVIKDASRLFTGLFYEFLEVRSCDFNSFGFDSKDNNSLVQGYKRYVL